MKFLIGLFFGLAIASASADSYVMRDGFSIMSVFSVHRIDLPYGQVNIFEVGQKPDGTPSVIQVDESGHVICSTKDSH